MSGNPWFEIDDPTNELEFNEAELAFAARLREVASSWEVQHAHNMVARPEDGSSLLAVVALIHESYRLMLGEFGVQVVGSTMRGDHLDNLLYYPGRPTSLATEAAGSPQQLAEHAAQWFEVILRKPIVRYEWEHKGQVYAHSYLFADSEEGLIQGYNDRLAPHGQKENLREAGYVTPNGWVQVKTSGLGRPHRIIPVR